MRIVQFLLLIVTCFVAGYTVSQLVAQWQAYVRQAGDRRAQPISVAVSRGLIGGLNPATV